MSSNKPRLALVSEDGQIIADGVEVNAVRQPKRRKRYTMIFQEAAAKLCSEKSMSAADWRVLWALITHMPMRKSGHPQDANVWYGTQHELAELVDLNRSTVNRSIAKLTKLGVIAQAGHCRLAVHSQIASRGAEVRSIGPKPRH